MKRFHLNTETVAQATGFLKIAHFFRFLHREFLTVSNDQSGQSSTALSLRHILEVLRQFVKSSRFALRSELEILQAVQRVGSSGLRFQLWAKGRALK